MADLYVILKYIIFVVIFFLFLSYFDAPKSLDYIGISITAVVLIILLNYIFCVCFNECSEQIYQSNIEESLKELLI